ncbi:unnamed protein product [Tuber melanosporum]|uniref:(Perigord truffle) hypothetical protein n=1 Tax=Tuber melanosporum (strain Mel28) TaxID=656061 RepID=D5GAA8_TUBMM|nr:uncharacterized protein GSTUM_00005211001 [Tuber melanosporum]CAZ81462.1 unnamed protein product [Tuber melanosporum]
MEDSSGSRSPLPHGPNSSGHSQTVRSRSRSIASNSSTPHPNAHPRIASGMPQYNQEPYNSENHPMTHPSLLVMTHNQITEIQPPIGTSLEVSPQTNTAFPIDPALGGSPPEQAPLPELRSPTTPVSEIPNFSQDRVPKDEESREFDSGMIVDEEEENAGPSSGRNSKRGSAIVEDSDAELRRLAEENKTVPLDELARRVRNDENTPSAEKTRQVYGLGWYVSPCPLRVAVPRNRVYARYVGICANERIKPLNPASFGKLVRLMFPEIKTRRLGVRGQSKYHYCGIRLAGEQSSPKVLQGSGSASGSEPPAQAAGDDHLQVFNPSAPLLSKLLTDSRMSNGSAPPFTFLSMKLSSFLQNELYFSRNEADNLSSNEILKLPDIDLYAPPGTDPDISATLTAIYRSHCTSLIECVRYMRLKQFHQLFISFHGTLTTPVQKLLGEPSIASWIRESDWVMYKEMIRLLSPLALQVVPPFVVTALRHLSTNLTSHISMTFAVQPQHVIDAKIVPSSIFSSLLDRLLRVNDAAHAAARFLGNPPDREQMVKDWKDYVNAQTIVDRELPCGSATVREILQTEVITLLQPPSTSVNGIPEVEDGSASTESVLDRWTQFLTYLPHRFPGTDPRLFNLCLGAAASAALRDLTTNGAVSFGSWWVVRCWVDEWMGWLAERGGFLRHSSESSIHIGGGHVGAEEERVSVEADLIDNGDELGHDDSGISLRGGEEPIHLLDEVGDDRDNRMVTIKFSK